MKPETSLILHAGNTLTKAYEKSTDHNTRGHIAALCWEILVVAAQSEKISVDDLLAKGKIEGIDTQRAADKYSTLRKSN